LKNIELSRGLLTIDNSAFAGSGIVSLTIPSTISSMGMYICQLCESLETITFDEGITNTPSYCCWGCSSLVNLNLPSTITRIKTYSFYTCSALTELNLPESLVAIEDSAFASCSSIKELHIPSKVSMIGKLAFARTSGSMGFTDIYFHRPSGSSIDLPTAGSSTGMFYVKTAINVNIYTDNTTVKNYDWASDNVTATFYHLDGTLWE
jgi:hypothetical protein